MNKTVNINLAGIFFHIDEDAYAKLQHYLDAIKRSFTNTQGKDEIIADIEARIAELFNEKKKEDRQVISIKEVEEVIAIMGQPEDYMVDEEIFEDEPVYTKTTKSPGKQLFRDTEHSYVGGVSSGLGHYLGIDFIWVRLLWILLTIFSSGAFILIYIALWIFVPEAKTTADKLAMRGEEVTISNIEKKIREGFDNVTGKVKDVDYQKYGNQAKSGATSAATAIGDVIGFILKVFVKLIGILLILIAGAALISLFIGLFTVGTFGLIDAPWSSYVEMAVSGAPLWLLWLLSFLLVGIPFFFLFILGLKILVGRLKSIGTPAKLVLLGLWLLALIGAAIIGIQQATHRAFDGEQVITETLPISANDTLYLVMQANPNYSSSIYRSTDFKIKYDDNDEKVLYSSNVRLIVKPTKDSLAKIEIVKSAEGKDYKEAKERAQNIVYNTSFNRNELLLKSFFTSATKYKYRDQKVKVTLYLPTGASLFADDNTSSFHRNTDYWGDILINGDEEKILKITEDAAICEDCPVEEWETESEDEWNEDGDFNARINSGDEEVNIQINSRGVTVDKKPVNKEQENIENEEL
ncbi:PspC domain-containing protein [Salegentibacter salegens]|uniref:Phage shock protein C (PspC) family protein n=1 Tax=Salegentibacter salegens TaxID=143223 RepID=A0A1M7JN54_9FLAO|nr:PspC domain-containing protein [Salegentibacter salegens]PRX51869.1 phage shock protein C (PspC) family protein [Salegentibacter salegens]SHM54335.1 phage shock protein C (PspC) family protein [Salegentibacter salegens]